MGVEHRDSLGALRIGSRPPNVTYCIRTPWEGSWTLRTQDLSFQRPSFKAPHVRARVASPTFLMKDAMKDKRFIFGAITSIAWLSPEALAMSGARSKSVIGIDGAAGAWTITMWPKPRVGETVLTDGNRCATDIG